jgi:hypothetical protein
MVDGYQHSEINAHSREPVAYQPFPNNIVTHPAVPIIQKKSREEEKLQSKPADPLNNNALDDISERNNSAIYPEINHTDMPDQLQAAIEKLSDFSMNDVKVNDNSGKPAQLNALAYAQGTDIHIAPGQERHLPHEAWHVVQQKQGKVRPTMQMKDVTINDDEGLEYEADVMGGKAVQIKKSISFFKSMNNQTEDIVQRRLPETMNSHRTIRVKAVQEIVNKSPQAEQMAQFKDLSGKIVQRVVNLSTLSSTENKIYYTIVGGGNELISKASATAPEPKPLYNEKDEIAPDGDKLKVWKPRSKFADKKKLSGQIPIYGTFNQILTKHFDIEDKVLDEIMSEVERDINNRQGDKGLRLGTAGMNDCKGYAITLKAMIAKYGENPQGLVGKSWLHETKPKEANFPYHGATVVAQDANDAVTLEAHAGQDLTAPMFHIRQGGKSGFEDSNKESYPNQYQDTALESPIMSIEDAEHILMTLKTAWDDQTQRSDKSAVKESGSIPESTGTNWKLIGTLLLSAIGALVAIHQFSQNK